jgi:hypothetical protein
MVETYAETELGWAGLGDYTYAPGDYGYLGKSTDKVILEMGPEGAISIELPALGAKLMSQH